LGTIYETAILGSIGRKHVCLALSDAQGTLLANTIRSYNAAATTGVSAALIGFQRDLALPTLPHRAAIAVAGLARGDAISITHTRWFVSRSGLKAMMGHAPLILNDFAAEAWALCSEDVYPAETFGTLPAPEPKKPGCYVVVGITSGLGVAVMNRDVTGAVRVLPTEAGHGAFAPASEELARLAADLFPGRYPVAAEEVVSAPGLIAIYGCLARRAHAVAAARTAEEITLAAKSDPLARAACELLAKAFWSQLGSLVMTFGAWDGVLVTGGLANAIRPFLRRPEAQALFATSAKHQRVLQGVPRAYVTLDHAELVGAAAALRNEPT
jgi:glucokinase